MPEEYVIVAVSNNGVAVKSVLYGCSSLGAVVKCIYALAATL